MVCHDTATAQAHPQDQRYNASRQQARRQDAKERLMQEVMRLCCSAEQEVCRLQKRDQSEVQQDCNMQECWTVTSEGLHSAFWTG